MHRQIQQEITLLSARGATEGTLQASQPQAIEKHSSADTETNKGRARANLQSSKDLRCGLRL